MLAALTALQQADTAFPSGSFAFSNGLEGLVAENPAFDEAALARTVAAALRFRWAGTDRVALILAHRAGRAIERLAAIDAAVEAASLSEPMRVGSRRNGASLLASHSRLGTPGAADLRAALRAGRMLGHLPTVQGALWPGLGLDERTAASVSGYLFASGLTSAAVRLGAGAQGQSAGGQPLRRRAQRGPRRQGDPGRGDRGTGRRGGGKGRLRCPASVRVLGASCGR